MRRWFAVSTAVVPFALFALGACSSEDKPAAPQGDAAIVTPTTTPTTDPCSPAAPGCKCKEVGAVSECKVYRKSGDYISCSTGSMTCGETGTWGTCEGAAVVWDGG